MSCVLSTALWENAARPRAARSPCGLLPPEGHRPPRELSRTQARALSGRESHLHIQVPFCFCVLEQAFWERAGAAPRGGVALPPENLGCRAGGRVSILLEASLVCPPVPSPVLDRTRQTRGGGGVSRRDSRPFQALCRLCRQASHTCRGTGVTPGCELEGPGMSSSDVPKPLHCSKAGPGDTAALGQPVLGSSGAAPLPTGEGTWGDSVWPLLLPHPSLTSHHADNHFVQIAGATL